MRVPKATGLSLLLVAAACNDRPTTSAPSGSSQPSATAAVASAAPSAASSIDTKGAVVAIPFPAERVIKAVNPKNESPYTGPVGTLKGNVRMEGGMPPDVPLTLPKECPGEANATHGKLFRIGQEGTLADVIVGVTGYKGFVPAREEAKKVTIHGCALSRRTLALTYGQRLEVANLDATRSYMPYLDGGDSRAVLVAMPGGEPVRLYPQEPNAHYMLRDQLPKPFMTADVYTLKYATHDVTGLDGGYEIKGIPVGKVKVSAFLPAINQTVEKDMEIKEGDNSLDFMMHFDKGAPKPAPKK
jgi:hypothetical protein